MGTRHDGLSLHCEVQSVLDMKPSAGAIGWVRLPWLLNVTSRADHGPSAIIFWSVYLRSYLLLTRVAAVRPRQRGVQFSFSVCGQSCMFAESVDLLNSLPNLPILEELVHATVNAQRMPFDLVDS